MKSQMPKLLQEKNRGSVLLFCLGVLALLSLLATAMFFMARNEESESRRFMNDTRAEFAAESGVEAAIAQIMGMKADLQGKSGIMGTVPDTLGYPLDLLLQSSFGSIDRDGDGYKELAGYVSETFSKHGDNYRLRVELSSSKLNINDTNSPLNEDTDPYEDQWTPERNYLDIPMHLRNPSDPADPNKDQDPDWVYPGDPAYDFDFAPVANRPYPKAKGRLWTIVSELVNILFQNTDSPTLGEKTANAVFAARRKNQDDRFSSMRELRDVLVPGVLSGEQFDVFKSHICLDSWQDKNVLKPTFQWRINTPPIVDPNLPHVQPTQHLTDYPGDCVWGYNNTADGAWDPMGPNHGDAWRGAPCARPGSKNPGKRGADIKDEVVFDFNNNGNIEAWEHFRHDKDIYMFSDMQTRYFENEARSPVNVNTCPLELLEALIAPVQGWYLKEAPSLWLGEDPKSRAEDWSQSKHQLYYYYATYPWMVSQRYGVYMHSGTKTRAWDWQSFQYPDECQYYYYDSYARSYMSTDKLWWWGGADEMTIEEWELFMANWQPGDWSINAYSTIEKSGRFGELQQSDSFRKQTLASTGKTIAKVLSEKIYDRIHHSDLNGDGEADYNPFRTWEEFEYFIMDLADLDDSESKHLTGSLKDFDIYMAHALIANFNPNARLNDFNPDKREFLYVDKSQLIGFSAELCFHNLSEVQIESLGQVVDESGAKKSESYIRCVVRAAECFRVSTQQQLMKGYEGTVDSAKALLGESDGENPTSGAVTTNGLVPAGNFRGYTLQSYPEAELAVKNFINDSAYDGSLKLATLQPEQPEFFAFSSSQGANNSFVANINRVLDAGYAEGKAEYFGDNLENAWRVDPWRYRCWDPKNPAYVYDRNDYPPYTENGGGALWKNWLPDLTAQIPSNNPGYRPLCKSLRNGIYSGDFTADMPGHLHPDGVLSDTGRTPIYEDPGNLGSSGFDPAGEEISGRLGSVQFWMKPNFDVAHSNRVRNFFNAPPRLGRPNGGVTLNPMWIGYAHGNNYSSDATKELSLYYLAHGGRRVMGDPDTGRLDDTLYTTTFHPHWTFHEGRSLPTRSLLFANGNWGDLGGFYTWTPASNIRAGRCPGLVTTSVNQNWRQEEDTPSPIVSSEYNLESHQWSHIALSWNWMGDYVGNGAGHGGTNYIPSDRYFYMAVNGKPVESFNEQKPEIHPQGNPNGNFTTQLEWAYFGTTSSPLNCKVHHTEPTDPALRQPNYFRFGESSSANWKNIVADATFDDFVSNKVPHMDPNLQMEFSYGRYYCNKDAAYTSGEFDLFSEMECKADKLDLMGIFWTGYWPRNANPDVKADHPRFNDQFSGADSNNFTNVAGMLASSNRYNPAGGPDPMSNVWGKPWVPFSVDVQDPVAGDWYYKSKSLPQEDMPNYAGGSSDPDWNAKPLIWHKNKKDKFQFRVHFNVKEGQTLFASPVLDDITFIFGVNRAKILSWEKE